MFQNHSKIIAPWMLAIAFGVVLSPVAYAQDAKLINMIQDLQSQMNELKQGMASQNEVIQKLQQENQALRIKVDGSQRIGHIVLDEGTSPASPNPLDGFKFSGDLRLRYAAKSESSGSPGVANDRNRFRYRLRYGLVKEFNEEMKIGFRLASGNVGTVTSRNETFDTQFGLKNIGIDQAYATYTPNWAKTGLIDGLEITAGKFKNPLLASSTPIVWDGDVTPEGIYEELKFNFIDSEDFDLKGSFLAGQWIVEEGNGGGVSEDSELFVYRGGFHSKIHGITEKPIEFKNYLTFLDYKEITSPGNFGVTNGNFTDNGGLSAEDFKVIDIYNEIGFQIGSLPKSKLFFEWIKNIDESATPALGGGQDKGWNLGLKVGSAKKKKGWEAGYQYFQIEANAVPGRFNDGDYGHSDSRGSKIHFAYGLTDYLTFKTTLYLFNRITGGGLTADEETRVINTDLVWKF